MGTGDVYKRQTQSISVSVLENQAPIVTLPDAGTRGNTAPFTVDAEDADGEVSLVDLFIDGTFFASVSAAPYIFDLSAVSPGPHMLRAVAYDNYGLSGQAEAEYTLLAYTKNLLLDTDLTGYKGGNGTGFAVLDSRNLGYSKGQVIDGSHGTSLVLGAEGDTKEIGPYLYFELGDATPDVVFSCDIYLPDTNATVTSWVRNLENSNCLNLFVFKKGGDIEFWGDGGVAKTAKFLPETWYHAETRLYGTDKTYDCTSTTQNPEDVYKRQIPQGRLRKATKTEIRGQNHFAFVKMRIFTPFFGRETKMYRYFKKCPLLFHAVSDTIKLQCFFT